MAINFCPLEVDWGNGAEMAAVVVAVIGAAAVAWLALQANKMTNSSARDAKRLRGIESDALLIMFEADLKALRFQLRDASALVAFDEGDDELANVEELEKFFSKVEKMELTEITKHFSRIHVLPHNVAPVCALVLGNLSALKRQESVILGMETPSSLVKISLQRSLDAVFKPVDHLYELAKKRRQELVPDTLM